MGLLNKKWLSSPPHDYELKKYILLDAIQHIKGMIENGEIYDALVEVEERLLQLYKFHGSKSALEDEMKILKGINLDTMSLDYEYPENLGEMSDIYKMCDYAIDEFEDLFKLIRKKWRDHSSKIKISEVPEKRPTKENGYTFIIGKNQEEILVYKYDTLVSNTDWKTMKLHKITSIDNQKDALPKYVESIEGSDNFRFWRIDHSLGHHNFEKGVFEIIKYNLFYKIIVS